MHRIISILAPHFQFVWALRAQFQIHTRNEITILFIFLFDFDLHVFGFN